MEIKWWLRKAKSKSWLSYYNWYQTLEDWTKISFALFKNTKKTSEKQPELNYIITIKKDWEWENADWWIKFDDISVEKWQTLTDTEREKINSLPF